MVSMINFFFNKLYGDFKYFYFSWENVSHIHLYNTYTGLPTKSVNVNIFAYLKTRCQF